MSSWVSGFKSDRGTKDLASLVWKLGWVAMKRKRGKTCHCCVVKLQVTVLCHKYDHQSQNLFAFKTNSKEKVKSYHFHLTNNHSALLCSQAPSHRSVINNVNMIIRPNYYHNSCATSSSQKIQEEDKEEDKCEVYWQIYFVWSLVCQLWWWLWWLWCGISICVIYQACLGFRIRCFLSQSQLCHE